MPLDPLTLKINHLDHNYHTDSDDDDGNQREQETLNEFSNENSMYIYSIWNHLLKRSSGIYCEQQMKPCSCFEIFIQILTI